MIKAILGQKQSQSQKFLEDGTRIPITEVYVPDNPVVFVKTKDKDSYWAVQLGFGTKKHPSQALLGHTRGARLKTAPRFLREVRLEGEVQSEQMPKPGDLLKASEIFKPGDIVDVTGVSKGKGFAGVVKRHHFRGGPRTHGQSDRERAPGSIGQTTTPGRVYKGKRMAGRMGHARVTVKNLKVVDVLEDKVLIKGLIPGGRNGLVVITKVGEGKKFMPLYRKEPEEIKEPEGTEVKEVKVEAETEDIKSSKSEIKEKKQDAK